MRRFAVVVTALVAVAGAGAPAAHAAVAPNPTTNIAPSPDFWPTCSSSGVTSSACVAAVLQAIDNARAAEGVGPMVLPAGFASMSTAEQTFVVSNLERVDRGLTPAAGMVASLDTLATSAAGNDADPVLPSWTVDSFAANRWGSIWAGDLNALAADYDWMYDDGWGPTGSFNVDCTSATDSGCWGHRDNILMDTGGAELITGVGSAQQTQWTSIAQILVVGNGTYPALTMSWADVTGANPAPDTAAPPGPVTDASAASMIATSTVVAGVSTRVVGRLTDVTTHAPVAGAPVRICRQAATATSATCSNAVTDAYGAVTVVTSLSSTTTWWLTYAGAGSHAPTASPKATVRVRPAVHLRAAWYSGAWSVVTTVSPVRAQSVTLQRHATTGWVTVRRVGAASWLRFGGLHSGSYRVVVSAVPSLTSTLASLSVG